MDFSREDLLQLSQWMKEYPEGIHPYSWGHGPCSTANGAKIEELFKNGETTSPYEKKALS